MKLAFTAVLFAASLPLVAQTASGAPDTPPPPPPPGAHEGGPGGPHGPRFGGPLFGPVHRERALPITNSPFTAQFTEATSFTDREGKQVQRSSTSTVYRDSQGRVREDITLPPPPPRPAKAGDAASSPATPATPGAPRTMTVILDPVAHTVTRLNAERKTAMVETVPTDFFTRMQDRERRRENGKGPHGRDNATVTDLGNKVIAGIPAKGERTTHTLPAHEDETAQTVTREVWFSPDVKLEAGSSETSPRMSHTETLASFNKAEPSADLFKVPSGYTTQAAPERHTGGRHDGPDGPGGQDAPPPPPAM